MLLLLVTPTGKFKKDGRELKAVVVVAEKATNNRTTVMRVDEASRT